MLSFHGPTNPDKPTLFWHREGAEVLGGRNGTSYSNPTETAAVARVVKTLIASGADGAEMYVENHDVRRTAYRVLRSDRSCLQPPRSAIKLSGSHRSKSLTWMHSKVEKRHSLTNSVGSRISPNGLCSGLRFGAPNGSTSSRTLLVAQRCEDDERERELRPSRPPLHHKSQVTSVGAQLN